VSMRPIVGIANGRARPIATAIAPKKFFAFTA
jgi:hypothetical protein